MTNEQEVLIEIQKLVAALPADERQAVGACALIIRLVVERWGDIGNLAFALVGAEKAAAIPEDESETIRR